MMRNNWYHHWVAGATLDDQLWHQALVMDCVLESLRGSEQGPNDVMMWILLCRGMSGPLYPSAPSALFCALSRPASPTSSAYPVGCPSPT